jgi:hypothetical protein
MRTWLEKDEAAFAAAIGSLSLLQSLALDDFSNLEVIALTIRQLRSHKCLRKLSIAYCNEPFSEQKWTVFGAVSSILQSSVPLEVLESKLAKFKHSSMVSGARLGIELEPRGACAVW